MLYRTAEEKINNWITEGKDAFLLTGARQIGKTYLIRHCLEQAQIPYLEINFIEQPELVEVFTKAKDAKDLLLRLSVIAKEPLITGKTIFFFR